MSDYKLLLVRASDWSVSVGIRFKFKLDLDSWDAHSTFKSDDLMYWFESCAARESFFKISSVIGQNGNAKANHLHSLCHWK